MGAKHVHAWLHWPVDTNVQLGECRYYQPMKESLTSKACCKQPRKPSSTSGRGHRGQGRVSGSGGQWEVRVRVRGWLGVCLYTFVVNYAVFFPVWQSVWITCDLHWTEKKRKTLQMQMWEKRHQQTSRQFVFPFHSERTEADSSIRFNPAREETPRQTQREAYWKFSIKFPLFPLRYLLTSETH